MGFFSHTKGLNKIANALANVKNLLDGLDYNPYPELEDYLLVAWICRVGIMDVMEAESMRMNYTLFAPIDGHTTRLTIHEAFMMSVGRLIRKAEQLDESDQEAILDVLDRGEWFDKVDKSITLEKRKIITRE